ncbi:hypothetical protein [Halogeometricum limi]|uniref:DUF7981 domain-containing protein n=1 Tax=Halogeometricum limi TaxID=555875 RepID=A0A1I6FZJ1_9EURY|nr:hypothetical protein [Halogeometricum limi]SFR35342.1 hypothetical protein SAMN04488124_0603 [Halogeometricum limi]
MSRRKSAALWGVVGALTFLVLVQGYQLVVAALGVGISTMGALAVGVGVVVGSASYVTENRLAAKGRT